MDNLCLNLYFTNTTYEPYDPRNSNQSYPSGGKSQSEMNLSIGSNGNYGLGSRYRTFGCQILEISDFPRELEATIICGAYDPRNSSKCYPSDGNSQSEMILSIGSNENCGLRSRNQTFKYRILEIYDFPRS